MRQLTIAAALTFAMAAPSNAATYLYNVSGTITSTEGNASGAGISVGDTILGSFAYDDSLLGAGTVIPLGGGTNTIYSAQLSQLQLSVGSYNVSYAPFTGSITYGDNVFGQDSIVFLLGGLPGGPFGSTFANLQLQARGPAGAINADGSANGMPLERFQTSFFGSFGNGTTSKRVFGTLDITAASAVPEPATWAMMILGFGMTGFQLRRRRAQKILVI